MSWGVLFWIREYLKGGLWFCPLIGAIFSPLIAVIVYQVDAQVTVPAGWQHALQTAPILIAVVTAFLAMKASSTSWQPVSRRAAAAKQTISPGGHSAET